MAEPKGPSVCAGIAADMESNARGYFVVRHPRRPMVLVLSSSGSYTNGLPKTAVQDNHNRFMETSLRVGFVMSRYFLSPSYTRVDVSVNGSHPHLHAVP